MAHEDKSEFDNRVRLAIYHQFVNTRRAPTIAEIAARMSLPGPETKAAFQRLAEAHIVVLQRESGEILMANPLSAVPTAFPVETSKGEFWGNCIWDAMGAIAMLGGSGRVKTSCGCCSEAMTVEVRNGSLIPVPGIIHFAVPAAHWWDDIVFN